MELTFCPMLATSGHRLDVPTTLPDARAPLVALFLGRWAEDGRRVVHAVTRGGRGCR